MYIFDTKCNLVKVYNQEKYYSYCAFGAGQYKQVNSIRFLRAHSEQAVIAHACHGHTHSSYQLGCLSRTEG